MSNKKGSLVVKYKYPHLKTEKFKNISDADKVIAKRNVQNIASVTWYGEPYDINHLLKLYKDYVPAAGERPNVIIDRGIDLMINK